MSEPVSDQLLIDIGDHCASMRRRGHVTTTVLVRDLEAMTANLRTARARLAEVELSDVELTALIKLRHGIFGEPGSDMFGIEISRDTLTAAFSAIDRLLKGTP